MNSDQFVWFNDKGVGFYPVKDTWYDDRYFEASIENSLSPIAEELNKFRARIVDKYLEGKLVLDFGTGCGVYLTYRENTVGYDICPKAIEDLKRTGNYFDYYRNGLDDSGIEGITFFDVIEHLRHPESVLDFVTGQFIFISLPIFRDRDHVLGSKHFKINEHFWYYTDHAFRAFMEANGFELIEVTDEETTIGREDIFTYVYRKKTCEKCYWFSPLTLPIEREEFGGHPNNALCRNLFVEKRLIHFDDFACRRFLNESYIFDGNKMEFVPPDEWRPVKVT